MFEVTIWVTSKQRRLAYEAITNPSMISSSGEVELRLFRSFFRFCLSAFSLGLDPRLESFSSRSEFGLERFEPVASFMVTDNTLLLIAVDIC